MLSQAETHRAIQALCGFLNDEARAQKVLASLQKRFTDRKQFAKALNDLLQQLAAKRIDSVAVQVSRCPKAARDFELIKSRRSRLTPEWAAVVDEPDRAHDHFTIEGLREVAESVSSSGQEWLEEVLSTATEEDMLRTSHLLKNVLRTVRPM